jgi:YfiH family protein
VTSCLRSELLSRAGFRHGFSLRTGGVSQAPFAALNLARNVGDAPEAVRENHRIFAAELGFAPERLYEVSQVHGAAVERAQPSLAPAEFRQREADALVLLEPGFAIGVRVADCVPLLVAHAGTGAVSAIHAGWRGVVSGVVHAGLEALCKLARAEPRELLCAIGPHIGPESFEVGDEVARELAAAAPPDARVVIAREPRPHVNLERAVRAQLLRCGVTPENIERVPGCTFREPQRFFSFRRDGARSGRHLAAIVAGC